MSVEVKRALIGDVHEDQKWFVLEGSIPGVPEVTKRRAINTSALVDGSLSIASEKAALVADVEEYYARYLAVKQAEKDLNAIAI